MLQFDTQKCLVELRQADTADLLDRVTAYRQGMEPEAIELIEQELQQRGIDQAAMNAHAERCVGECLFDANGTAQSCSRCRRPAVAVVRRWQRLWRVLPIYSRSVRLCKEHLHADR
jgi:ATP-dependent helicase YprA (DUF1998 family)